MSLLRLLPTLLLFAAVPLPAEPISFAALGPRERIEVRVTAQGCFGRTCYELTVVRGACTVVEITQQWDEARRVFAEVARRPLGSVPLAEPELAALDELLVYYKTEHRSICTSAEAVVLRKHRFLRAPLVERYEDSSCERAQRPELLTFDALIARAIKRCEAAANTPSP